MLHLNVSNINYPNKGPEMAIIKHPRQPINEPEKTEGIINTSPPPMPPGPGENTNNDNQSSAGVGFPLKYIVSVVVVIGVVAALYFAFTKFDGSLSPSPSHLDHAVVSLEIERMMRIGGIMDLLKKKIAQTEISLKKSEKIGDMVLIDTMRLGLARNLNDLVKHQGEFIAGLVILHQFYAQNPDGMVKLLKELLKTSKDAYKVGNSKTVNNIRELIRSVPEETLPYDYFKRKIKVQI